MENLYLCTDALFSLSELAVDRLREERLLDLREWKRQQRMQVDTISAFLQFLQEGHSAGKR